MFEKMIGTSVPVPMRISLELLSRLELPNLILTKDALYHLSYNSVM